MFEKLSIPDAKKENLESPKENTHQQQTVEDSSLLCTGLMLAALAMPALSGVAEASESVAVPNIEYVVSNDDLPVMEDFISSSITDTTAIASIGGQHKEQTKSGGWIKPVLAIVSAIAKAMSQAQESEEDEDS